jgi:aspartyl-tRNA(Asn)/glutamyl-tRNA(Gln) amidotransferase subunit A
MPDLLPLTFAEWQQLAASGAGVAAREVRRRAERLLSPAQQRAVIAWMPREDALAALFSAADKRAPLSGVPYFLKDLFDLAGQPTRAGSTFLPEIRPLPERDAALPSALRKVGAVCAGKAHLHEFAYGISGENPHYGDCEHPRFPGRTTGGSSSGSAAAVAAGIVPFAIGTDTGGSVRVPAAFCGLFGFRMKPRHAWIADAFPLSPSCDTAGWFTANSGDMLAANSALLGVAALPREPRGCYLEYGALDEDVAAACRTAARRLTSPADEATHAALATGFAPSIEAYNTTVSVEAWEVHKSWAEERRNRYSPAVWQRLDRIRTVTPDQRAQTAVHIAALQLLWTNFFLTYDFLVMPAAPCAALKKAELTAANRMRILALTAPASLGGLPALTLPVPLPSGLTAGLQVIVNNTQSPVIPWALEKWK